MARATRHGSLEIVRVGSGRPELWLIAGVHGDEVEGMVVVEEALRTLAPAARDARGRAGRASGGARARHARGPRRRRSQPHLSGAARRRADRAHRLRALAADHRRDARRDPDAALLEPLGLGDALRRARGRRRARTRAGLRAGPALRRGLGLARTACSARARPRSASRPRSSSCSASAATRPRGWRQGCTRRARRMGWLDMDAGEPSAPSREVARHWLTAPVAGRAVQLAALGDAIGARGAGRGAARRGGRTVATLASPAAGWVGIHVTYGQVAAGDPVSVVFVEAGRAGEHRHRHGHPVDARPRAGLPGLPLVGTADAIRRRLPALRRAARDALSRRRCLARRAPAGRR